MSTGGEEFNFVGFFELGRSYLQSARLLETAAVDHGTDISVDHPLDFLYAHALELMLKGCLLEHDPALDIRRFRHDLLAIYDHIRDAGLHDRLLLRVEKSTRDRWNARIRGARDTYRTRLTNFGIAEEHLGEFGDLSNHQIGAALPELRQQIVWVDDHHRDGGGSFRYFRRGWYSRPKVTAFGLADDVFRLTARWACEDLYEDFRRRYRGGRCRTDAIPT